MRWRPLENMSAVRKKAANRQVVGKLKKMASKFKDGGQFQAGVHIPRWHPNSNMAAKFQDGGQIPRLQPNSKMVAKFQDDRQIPGWRSNSKVAAKFQDGGQIPRHRYRRTFLSSSPCEMDSHMMKAATRCWTGPASPQCGRNTNVFSPRSYHIRI